MVRDAAALGDGQLGRADVHAAVDLHRVGVDDLAAEALGQVEAQAGLARCGGADEGDDRLGHGPIVPARLSRPCRSAHPSGWAGAPRGGHHEFPGQGEGQAHQGGRPARRQDRRRHRQGRRRSPTRRPAASTPTRSTRRPARRATPSTPSTARTTTSGPGREDPRRPAAPRRHGRPDPSLSALGRARDRPLRRSSRRPTSTSCARATTAPRCCSSCARARPTWTGTGRPPRPGTSSGARRRTTPRTARHVEELGVTDVALEFAFTMQRTQHADPIDERVDWFFTARSWSGEPRVVEPEKARVIGWCPLDGAARADGAARGARPRAALDRRAPT